MRCICGHGPGFHDFSDPREPCREIMCGCRRWRGVTPDTDTLKPVNEILDEVIATHAGQIRTHYTECYKYHTGCLAVLLKGTINE